MEWSRVLGFRDDDKTLVLVSLIAHLTEYFLSPFPIFAQHQSPHLVRKE
jgi:hypothetical protein